MKTLSKESILEATSSIRGGTIARISYCTELPLKAEFKKQGYKIKKYIETSVRIGVNYHNIASVKARKEAAIVNESKPIKKSNYEWILKNRVKYNTNTEKDYLVVAVLPQHSNDKVKYVIDIPNGSSVSNLAIFDTFANMVLDSYKAKKDDREIRYISFENIITINDVGEKINF